MNETRTFSENPFSIFKVIIPVSICVIIFAVILVSFNGVPKTGKYKDWSPQLLIFVISGSFVLINLIVFIAVSLMPKRTLFCDAKGFDIYTSNFWNNQSQTQNFHWDEISKLELNYVYKAGIFVEITYKHELYKIFRKDQYDSALFNELLEVLKENTPQLNYFWIPKSKFENQTILDETEKFCKVSRTPENGE